MFDLQGFQNLVGLKTCLQIRENLSDCAGIDMKLEICASNYQSAINAAKAGASRIELCSELGVGGITPSYGFIKRVVETIEIPIFVLVRARSGSFTYSDDEFEIMLNDIQICKELGCDGIVSGILNLDNSIDVKRTEQLVNAAKPMEFTFHRAFDWTPNPFDAMEKLIELRVDRILTSGQEISAEQGIVVLQQLKKLADGRIKILPGGGIKPDNVLIFKGGGFEEIHCSATTITPVIPTPKVPLNSPKFFDESLSAVSDIEKIQLLLSLMNDVE